jgi:Bacterial aa3 type cytochrome c oxidase subunit IV
MTSSDNQGDFRTHRETYEGVMTLLKWGTAAATFVAFVVVLWIAS